MRRLRQDSAPRPADPSAIAAPGVSLLLSGALSMAVLVGTRPAGEVSQALAERVQAVAQGVSDLANPNWWRSGLMQRTSAPCGTPVHARPSSMASANAGTTRENR